MQMERLAISLSRGGLTLALAAMLALSGCYEEEDETLPASTQGQEETGVIPDTWLDVGDGEAPLAFIARVTGEEAGQLAPLLSQAARRYRESPRMIANRVVQLQAEIRQRGEADISAVSLLQALTAGDRTPHGGSLGAVVQYYRVSRLQGADHAQALAGAMEDRAAMDGIGE